MREAILVVDDEGGVRSSLAGILGDEGYQVVGVESGEACLSALETRRYDLLLLDVWLPQMDGIETLERGVKALDPELPVVVISGHGSIETAVKAVRMGAMDFVEKPLSLEKTLLVVKNALKQRRLELENKALKEQIEQRWTMIGRERPDPGLAPGDRPGRAEQRPGADLRRERHGQGAGGPRHPPPEPAGPRPLRRGQLRRDPRRADRERAVRPRQGSLHRGAHGQEGQVRAGRRRDAVPRRGRRHDA